jgi:hypothetical protein
MDLQCCQIVLHQAIERDSKNDLDQSLACEYWGQSPFEEASFLCEYSKSFLFHCQSVREDG